MQNKMVLWIVSNLERQNNRKQLLLVAISVSLSAFCDCKSLLTKGFSWKCFIRMSSRTPGTPKKFAFQWHSWQPAILRRACAAHQRFFQSGSLLKTTIEVHPLSCCWGGEEEDLRCHSWQGPDVFWPCHDNAAGTHVFHFGVIWVEMKSSLHWTYNCNSHNFMAWMVFVAAKDSEEFVWKDGLARVSVSKEDDDHRQSRHARVSCVNGRRLSQPTSQGDAEDAEELEAVPW